MDAKELAKLLNGRNYGNEITKEEEKIAKENYLVVIFGCSDDCVELRGAIDEEFGDHLIYFNKKGLVENECNDGDCPYFEEIKEQSAKIQPEFCNYPDMPNGWGFKANNADGTEIPCETFDIMEDGEVFCRGIVFSLDDVK